MERQRHLEWEKQRIQDLQIHLNKELDIVSIMRNKNETLNTEYQTLVRINARYRTAGLSFCNIPEFLISVR